MTYDLFSLGWDEAFAAAYAPLDRSDAAPARVLRTALGVCTVMGADGVGRASLGGSVLLGAVRDPAGLPCAGDWVVVRRWPDRRHTVEVVLPRRSMLSGAAGAGGHVANVDTVAVVQPWHPAFDRDRVDRLLGLVRRSGARPLIVLSEPDSIGAAGRSGLGGSTVGERNRGPAAALRRLAAAVPEVPVLVIGARHRDAGLAALRELVPAGRTLALLGGPGSARSALVGALTGVTMLPTRPVTPSSTGGPDRRFASLATVVPVPGGGVVVDVAAADGDERSFRAPARLAAVVGIGDARRRPSR